MREIKFRQPLMSKGKFQSWHYWGFISKGNFSSPTNEWVSGEPSLQFTGLLDKSGKEIYEGDILEIGNQYGRYSDKVTWNDKSAMYYLPVKGFNLSHYDSDVLLVIGNIYEHKELINNQKEK